MHYCNGWWAGDDAGVPESIALALITDRWTEMLPEGMGIGRMRDKDHGEWAVHDDDTDTHWFGPTRFLALAEFHAPGSTKGDE